MNSERHIKIKAARITAAKNGKTKRTDYKLSVPCLFFPIYANNIHMKKLLNLKKLDFWYMKKPLIYLSVISAVTYILKLSGFPVADDIFLGAFIIIVFVSVLKHIKNKYYKITAAVLLFIAIILYLNIYNDFVEFLAEKCKENGILFGFVNPLFNTAGLTDLENLIYHTSYGGAKFINGKIVSGAADIFIENAGAAETYAYLSGRYIAILASFGIALSERENRGAFLFSALFSFLTGNLTPYLLMLFLLSTPDYFIFLLFHFFAFFAANFAQIRSGFGVNASVFELFAYSNNYVYTLVVGIFLSAVSYYIARLVKEKRKWYDKRGDSNEREGRAV